MKKAIVLTTGAGLLALAGLWSFVLSDSGEADRAEPPVHIETGLGWQSPSCGIVDGASYGPDECEAKLGPMP